MKTCARIALRELRALANRKQYLMLAVLMPLAYALLFTAVYWNKEVTEIPVTIVDQDHSALSREITQALLSTQTFKLGAYSESVNDFREQVIRGESHACFVFPLHFERDVKSGRGPKIAAWVDASNILIGNVAIAAVSEVVGTYAVGIDIRRSVMRGSAPASAPLMITQPIRDEYRIWYNPSFNYNYANFMLMGLVVVAIQLLTLLLTAGAGAREIEDDSVTELRSISSRPVSVIAGKAMAYIGIMFPASAIALHLPFIMLGVPMRGSELTLLSVTLWFIAMLTVLGIGVSALLKDSLRATEVFAIVAMPSYLASGYTWPSFSMPRVMESVSYALPLTPYLMAFRKITLLGDSSSYLTAQLTSLGAWTTIALVLAYVGVRRLLHASEEKH